MKPYTYPIYQPDLTGNERKYVNECLDSSWISSKGRFIGEFEQAFAKRLGVSDAASVCNGTVALHLALIALGIGPGDEVIVPTLTYIASVNAIIYTGATPVFVDSVANTWQIDPADTRRNITAKTKAVMAVHLYGQACDMNELSSICEEHRLFLIEDCAEAFGTTYNGKPAGTFGDIATFSFFGNKTITTGEGGMVVSKDITLMDRARHFKGQGLAAHREYWHDVVGYNYRMTNIEAAIGLAQLERADEFINRKIAIANIYKQELQECPVAFQCEAPQTKHSYWMVSILVEEAKERDELRMYLGENGIETRPVFYPVHTMPMYSKSYRRHPTAEDIAWRGINLPSWPGLPDSGVRDISAKIRAYYAGKK
jgi:perosamine synthetase